MFKSNNSQTAGQAESSDSPTSRFKYCLAGARSLLIACVIWVTVRPAAATHGSLECEPPESMMPLFSLLDSITQLAFLGGVALATLGFSVAGLCFVVPGQEWSQRGKQIAKSVLIGTMILLSADMVVSFIVNEMGGVVCN